MLRGIFQLVRKGCGVLQIPRNVIWQLFHGLSVDVSHRYYGLPWLRVGGCGSSIVIGRRFAAVSEISRNSFGIIQRVVIRTVGERAHIEIGDDVGVSGCTISAKVSIRIGDRVLIGSGAVITDQDAHPVDPVARRAEAACKTAPVVIEDDVFIGARAIILKGVTIGRGSTIGAGSVVTKSIPPYSVAVGNPARIIGDSRNRT